MEHITNQQWRPRPDDRHDSRAVRVSDPRHGSTQHPVAQHSESPRPYQHIPGPVYRPDRHAVYRSNRYFGQYVDSRDHGEEQPRTEAAQTYYQSVTHQTHTPPFVSAGHHLSHISTLATSQAALDSRPAPGLELGYVMDQTPRNNVVPTQYPPSIDQDNSHPTIQRQASLDKKTKPTIMTAKGSGGNNSLPLRDSETLPENDQSATMEALAAAIRQGLQPAAATSWSATPASPPGTPSVRMPFQDEPGSPTSVYTQVTGTRHNSVPRSPYHGHDTRHSRLSAIIQQEADDHEKPKFAFDPPTPSSHMSSDPIIMNGVVGTSRGIPANRRFPKLDIGAVRDIEARGSMTSLSDLIKRATRLASNLDRGRTASRLGYADMFGSSDQLSGHTMRASTYSDVLAAFPPPADRTGTPSKNRPNTVWPNGEKRYMTSKSSLGEAIEGQHSSKRKCCGMSPPIFVFVFIIILLLLALAILVPIFLIVIPRLRRSTNPSECSALHLCQNGGTTVFVNNVCSCICVDGFTGSVCSVERDPDCITASLSDGTSTFANATISNSVLPLLNGTQKTFNIPLNTTRILSTFAYNNLSCASENSLVDFDSSTSDKTKRLVIVPGTMSTDLNIPALNMPPSEVKEHKGLGTVNEVVSYADLFHPMPTRTLRPRQDAVQSTNGIVFATSSTSSFAPTVTTAAAASASDTHAATTISSSSMPSQSSNMKATDDQLDFAAAVVLYVLQSSPEINVAVAANQAIVSHFTSSNINNSTVEVVGGDQPINADFDKFEIIFGNGTIIGGSG